MVTATGVPRLVIAAPASGSGKTTVACGLMAALRAAGLAVSGHKIGPDYIDPGYHALATGRPARNLDPFLCGADRVVPLFAHGARGADVAVVEGVMGLFDGTDPGTGEGAGDPGFGSTAHVARLLGAPVVLVIDAASMGRSAGAVAAGFARFDPRTTVAGVILNRVASSRHEQLLRGGLAAAGIRVYGAIRRAAQVAAPSRHLGLVPAAERSAAATDAMARLAALIKESCDLPGLLALARGAPPLPGKAWDPALALALAAAPAAVPGPAPATPAAPAAPTSPAPSSTPTAPAAPQPHDSPSSPQPREPQQPRETRQPRKPARSSRSPGAPPSPSATPSTPNCLPRPAWRSSPSTRSATSTCPAARPASSWAAVSRKCTPPPCPPTNRCARRWPRPPRGPSPSRPNARACSTWPGPWTASPCAGCCPSRRP